MILVACAYVLFTVRDLTGWPVALLIGCAALLSVLNAYLILLLAMNYTWGTILKEPSGVVTTLTSKSAKHRLERRPHAF